MSVSCRRCVLIHGVSSGILALAVFGIITERASQLIPISASSHVLEGVDKIEGNGQSKRLV